MFFLSSLATSAVSLALLAIPPLAAPAPQKAKAAKKPPAGAPSPQASNPASVFAQKSGPLKAGESSISQMEDGAGLQSDSRFVPGETIFFSLVLENVKIGATGRVEVSAEMEAMDPKGIPIGPKISEQLKTSLADEDKDWKPKLRAQFQIPSIAPPGSYTVRYKATDLQTSETVEGERKFPVSGPDLERSEALVFRDFGFFRAEEDPTPLTVAAYRPGDTLWARFAITGYKYGPENSIDVTYDVAVQNAEGKEIFLQKDAAAERSKAFYPQPWVPGGINLSLQRNMRAGTYTLAITARDAVGNQTVTEKHPFRLEGDL